MGQERKRRRKCGHERPTGKRKKEPEASWAAVLD